MSQLNSKFSGDAPFSLLSRVFGDAEMDAIFSERRTVEGWLEAEAALAGAQAEVGVLSAAAAAEIASAATLANIDREELWAQTKVVGYPILPLVRMIDAATAGAGKGRVHYGATTQDIMDTGLALQVTAALDRIDALATDLGDAVAALVEAHRGTVLAARTHAQQAVPTTLGAKLAVFLAELARQRERLRAARPRIAQVSMFGAGGTAAAFGPDARRIRVAMAKLLGLDSNDVPWHVARDGIAEFGLLCASTAATCSRLAGEVIQLSRTEIGELAERDSHHRGASSTMPQKVNPISSEVIVGMAAAAGAASSALFRAMEAGHERSAGEWQIEWEVIPQLATLAGGSIAAAADLARGLRVFPEAMAANMAAGGGFILAEAHMMRLAERLGRERAHDLVYGAVREARRDGITLEQALERSGEVEGVSLSTRPADHLGDAEVTCEAALARWRTTRAQDPIGGSRWH